MEVLQEDAAKQAKTKSYRPIARFFLKFAGIPIRSFKAVHRLWQGSGKVLTLPRRRIGLGKLDNFKSNALTAHFLPSGRHRA
jgi:hypothetical protein